MNKSKKPFQWNKVTPLSKYLAMVLFVVLPFMGFVLGMKYQTQKESSLPTITEKRASNNLNQTISTTSPADPVLAENISGFDFTDSYTITQNNSLRFTINNPQKASGTVNIQENLCTNGISIPQVIALKQVDDQKYWCSDGSFYKQFINVDHPAAFILHVKVGNSNYEDQQLNSDDYFKAYYFDLNTKKWQQSLSMTSAVLPLKSKSDIDIRVGFGIPAESNKVILVTGKFGKNSVLRDSVQQCYLMDFTVKKASKTSCNIVW